MSTTVWIAIVISAIAVFALLIWFIRWWAQGGQFDNPDVRIDGKVAIVTGCNTGIGKETVLELARRGAKVYMACRNQQKCEEARLDIIKQTGNKNVINKHLDLASLDSVRKFVKEFLEEESHLHILINNAGVMFIPHTLTIDGFEMHLGANHLAHFLLTNLLLDTLKASMPSRVVVVSSNGHAFGRINRDDLNSEKSYNKYKAYFQSKLCNHLFTRALAKRLLATGVTVNCLHPGAVNTELQRHVSIITAISWPIFWLITKSPKSGAQTSITVALDPELEQVSGKYFVDCEIAKEASRARDDDTAEWLWNESEKLTDLNVPEYLQGN